MSEYKQDGDYILKGEQLLWDDISQRAGPIIIDLLEHRDILHTELQAANKRTADFYDTIMAASKPDEDGNTLNTIKRVIAERDALARECERLTENNAHLHARRAEAEHVFTEAHNRYQELVELTGAGQHLSTATSIHRAVCRWIKEQRTNSVSTSDVIAIIHTIAAQYPTDIWPDDGTTPDCKGAKMARLTCANIERELNEFIRSAATGEMEVER